MKVRAALRNILLATFISSLAAALSPLAAEAEPAGTTPRVGVLCPRRSSDSRGMRRDSFERVLRELGWRPGSDLILDYREMEKESAALTESAAPLVRLRVAVIVTCGGRATRAAQQVTSVIPIVIAATTDPNRSDFFFDMLVRGRRNNVTGLVLLTTDAAPTALELLSQAGPWFDRIAVLWDRRSASHPSRLKAVENAARTLGVQVRPVSAGSLMDLMPAFAAMRREAAKGVVILGSPYFFAETHRLVELAAKFRLPTMFASRDALEEGGLMSYSPNYDVLYRRTAGYVDKILRGVTPADLPIDQFSKFEFVINLKTAKTLGLTIPPSLLLRADQVIE